MKKFNLLKKISILSFLFLCLVSNQNIAVAEVYKWKNSDGSIFYSDIPPKNNNTEVQLIDVSNDNKSTTHIIRQKTLTDDSTLSKEIKNYKKIKQHHEDEDISGFIQNLKGKLQDYRKAAESLDNRKKSIDKTIDKQSSLQFNKKMCTIATDNLEQLGKGQIILNKGHKLVKLSKSEHAKKVQQTKKQVAQYC